MNVRIFNVCLLLGWLMVFAGGVVIHPGWGITVAGGLLIVLTLAAAHLAGWEQHQTSRPGASPEPESF